MRRIETAYDSQGNVYLLTSYDAASGGNVVNQVQREFNGLGQMTKQYQALVAVRDAEPRRRGVPPIKELLAAGVRVACGQDCVHDAFYPFGVADPLQVALILCHAAQLGTPDEVAAGLRMTRAAAASVIGLRDYGLAVGCVAAARA